MNRNCPDPHTNDHRVLPFRPSRRQQLRPDKTVLHHPQAPSPVRDLSKYQRSPPPDDYRQRMRVNAIVFVFTCMLVIAGTWMLNAITHPHS